MSTKSVSGGSCTRGYDLSRAEKVCVFGAGSFGTALGSVLAANGHHVTLLTRNERVVSGINLDHRNPVYVTGYDLPRTLKASVDPHETLDDCTFILHAIPVQSSPEYLSTYREFIPSDVPIISTSKGLHATSLRYMNEIIAEQLESPRPTAYLSGPSFARELLKKEITGVVVASLDENLAKKVQAMFANDHMRVYRSMDVVGVEVGGALKNVMAIGAGILDGLGFGPNSLALLITRGNAEIGRLAVAMGASPITLGGLSGMGDLMLTCYGAQSRNRTVGKRLGQGESLEDIMNDMAEVAEGVHTTPAAVTLSRRYGLDLHIVNAVNNVLNGSDAKEEIERLMNLPQVREFGDEFFEK